jgi:predicted metal-binding protein
MVSVTKESLGELVNIAKKLGVTDAKIIKPGEVVVRNWVRLKCQYGCGGYGQRLTCPPYSPTPEETRRILKEYEWAIFMKFEGAQAGNAEDAEKYEKSLPDLVVKIEREAFLKGYYAAFGMAAGPCPFCEDECNLEKCRHPYEARPSMEGCGIDVFATVRNAGFKIKVVRTESEKPTFYALLLVA